MNKATFRYKQRTASTLSIRRGVTATEVIVVFSVLCLLAALLLPALLSARDSARLLRCSNQLKQIGGAAHGFLAAKRRFPNPGRHLEDLLPFLEQEALANQLDTNPSGLLPGPGIFVCPSDPEAETTQQHASYRLNTGNRLFMSGLPNGFVAFERRTGIPQLHQLQGCRPVEVRDGLSNTAYCSERLVQVVKQDWLTTAQIDSFAQLHPARYNWHQKKDYSNQFEAEAPFHWACQMETNRVTVSGPAAGSDQAFARWGPYYNHIGLPNTVSCFTEKFSGGATQWTPVNIQNGSWAPGSGHSEGVNVLFGDGSTRSISNSVDLRTWRDLGDIAGANEVTRW